MLTIEIDASDMSREELRECAELECVETKDLVKLKDVTPDELGRMIASCLPSIGPQFFEGSGTYAKFTGAKVIRAEYA